MLKILRILKQASKLPHMIKTFIRKIKSPEVRQMSTRPSNKNRSIVKELNVSLVILE